MFSIETERNCDKEKRDKYENLLGGWFGKRFFSKATLASPCNCPITGFLTRPMMGGESAGSPAFPLEAALLASPQLALPRKRVESVSNFFTWQRNGDYEIHRTLEYGLPFPRKGSLVCFLSLEFGEDAMNTMLSPRLWLTLPLTLNPCWEGEELLTDGTVIGHILGLRTDSPEPFPPSFMSRMWERFHR